MSSKPSASTPKTPAASYTEKYVERALVKRCKTHDVICWKLESPSTSHVPDRIMLAAGVGAVFAELKRPGGKLRRAQANTIADMRAHGAEVHVVDTIEAAEALADDIARRSAASFKQLDYYMT